MFLTSCQFSPKSTDSGTASKVDSQSLDQCYSGPLHLTVLNPDGTPASNAPVGLGRFLYFEEANDLSDADRPPLLYAKQPRVDVDGTYQREKWRECMLPTFLYSADEAHDLAALKMIFQSDELSKLHTLRLAPARWIIGRAVSRPSEKSSLFITNIYPGKHLISRSLKSASLNGRFRFLLPPGDYILECQKNGRKSDPHPFQVVGQKSEMDLGEILIN